MDTLVAEWPLVAEVARSVPMARRRKRRNPTENQKNLWGHIHVRWIGLPQVSNNWRPKPPFRWNGVIRVGLCERLGSWPRAKTGLWWWPSCPATSGCRAIAGQRRLKGNLWAAATVSRRRKKKGIKIFKNQPSHRDSLDRQCPFIVIHHSWIIIDIRLGWMKRPTISLQLSIYDHR